MSTLPDSVYDDAVRAYLRVPARHHISIGHLRATIDDPAAFRAALTVAYEAGAEDALAMRDAATLLSDPAAGAVIDAAFFGVTEARASVALDGETVTLDEPQVTP